MSYNIDSSEYVSGKLYITAGAAKALLDEYEDDLPESNFVTGLPLKRTTPDDEVFEIKYPWWSGCGSGGSYDDVLLACLSKTTGEAKIAFTWEGGDSLTALSVKDGVVTKAKARVVVE